ncbi:MAG TPA: formate/nitrite transporter family protein [Nitrococcus sp.]|nr:formate/nitrite transporter family protein [Nitrococcus sp.]
MSSTKGDSPSEAKTYRQILLREIVQGEGELERSTIGLLLSGLSAGLDVGFSVFLMAAMFTLAGDEFPPAVLQILLANLYSVGFIFVVIGRSELFTEHTTLAVFPVLARRAKLSALIRLWVLVYLSNLVGATIFAFVVTQIGIGLGVTSAQAYQHLAQTMVRHSALMILLSGVLAGWLMGLLSWLVKAARETISQLFTIWLVASAIGLGHLHHCIVGSVEVLSGLFAGQQIGAADYWHFLIWTTLGNAIGGVLLVSILKFSHSVNPGKEALEEEVSAALEKQGSPVESKAKHKPP